MVCAYYLSPYLFFMFPSGIICVGWWACFAHTHSGFAKLFPGIEYRTVTLNINTTVPFLRELSLGLGSIRADYSSISNCLKQGLSVMVAVGGAKESFEAKPGQQRLLLKNRNGFIRAALENGCDLVPIFSFGETELYEQYRAPPGSYLAALQNWICRRFGFVVPMINGRGIFNYDFGIMPRRIPLNVVGLPLLTSFWRTFDSDIV